MSDSVSRRFLAKAFVNQRHTAMCKRRKEQNPFKQTLSNNQFFYNYEYNSKENREQEDSD